MTREDYLDYVAAFNAQDFRDAVERYYTEDVVAELGDLRLEGRDAFLGFFEPLHVGVEERLRPDLVLVDGDHIFVRCEIEFRCIADRPDFPMRPMKLGDVVLCDYFVLYRFRGGRICYLRTARLSEREGRRSG